MRQVEIDSQIDGNCLRDGARLHLVSREPIQNHARFVQGLCEDLGNDGEDDVVRHQTTRVHVGFHGFAELRSLRHFLFHVVSGSKDGQLG